jgi:tetratricopeptide (TPR) repeat protein
VILHALGATRFTGSLWGAHTYAFLPGPVFPAALVALALTLVLGFRALGRPAVPVATRPEARRPASATVLGRTGIAVAAFALLWAARSRQILLGDGIPLTANLPYETTLHAREPLTSLVHQQVYRLAHASASGRDVHAVARDAVAFGSALAGVVFVLVALLLAAELLRLRPGHGTREPSPRMTFVVAAMLCTQGFVQLFFGYVENYAFEAAAITAYLWLALRHLRGAAPLIAPAAALLAAIAFNLSALTLGISFLALVAIGLRAPGRRLATVRDLGLGALLAAGLALALQRFDAGYRLDRQALAMLEKGAADFAYMFSPEHYRDFLSEHVLIGPFALLWFLPVVLHAVLTRVRPSAALVFLAVAGAVQAAALWAVADLPLGYARDWDLFAPFAPLFAAAAIGLVLAQVRERRNLQRLALVVVAVSVFHTAPWIALNASADRSLERFKHLPLGQGRTESTVGFWYFSEGKFDEARVWLERALAADPTNVRAYAHLGNMELVAGRYDAAQRYFEEAVRRRPNQPMFRESLVRALLARERIPEALGHLAILVEQEPQRPRHWAMAAVLLMGVGRTGEAHEAMMRAVQLAPEDPVYASALSRLEQPDAYAALLANEWPLIVDR